MDYRFPGTSTDAAAGIALGNAFAQKFPAAAAIIASNPAGTQLVAEAAAAGVRFGGYAEDGPGRTLGRAYTFGGVVYVPGTEPDSMLQAGYFLYELVNGIQESSAEALNNDVIAGQIDPDGYAYASQRLETSAELRVAYIWSTIRPTFAADEAIMVVYDNQFFLSDYLSVIRCQQTQDELIRKILDRVYDTGSLKGLTPRDFYIHYYHQLQGCAQANGVYNTDCLTRW